jgi:hypothetical protein
MIPPQDLARIDREMMALRHMSPKRIVQVAAERARRDPAYMKDVMVRAGIENADGTFTEAYRFLGNRKGQ